MSNTRNLSEKLYFAKDYKTTLIYIILSILCGISAIYWQFWLLFEIICYLILITYFSNKFRDFFNIHAVVITLIILYSIPSTILILQGKIVLTENELLRFFSIISIGLLGYSLGIIFLRGLAPSKKSGTTEISVKINFLFWLTYKYRYILTLILCILLFYWGFMPRGMTYKESVIYRMEIAGIVRYLNSLIPTVFSALIIAMVSIVGDLKKTKRLSLLSYLLVVLVMLSIVGGHRSWIIATFACLMISFQPYLKRRHTLLIVILAFFATWIISGAVRYSRAGNSFVENAQKFYEYSVNIKNTSFTDLMWGWSSFNSPFSTFITIIKNIPENIKFEYSAYIKDFSLLIPEALYPNRPLPYNEWYVKTFEPELFQRGGGKTFYILGFGYLFAGHIGVLIYLFLFGILFEWLNKLFKTIGGAASLFLYSYFFLELIRFVVGCGFMAFIKTSIILNFSIPISLLFLFVLILDSFNPKKLKVAR